MLHCQSDVASTYQHLAKTVDRPVTVALHCHDSVFHIPKYGMSGSHRLGAMTEAWHLSTKPLDSRALTMRWRAVLLKLKLALCFRRYEVYEISGT